MSPTPTAGTFESIEVKRDYALILTNWLIENCNVSDDAMKKEIFDDFVVFTDAELIEKGKMLEEFMDNQVREAKQLLRITQSLSHSIDEENERIEVTQTTTFNF